VARSTQYPAIEPGPLCVDAINTVLGTELGSGHVWLSKRAHEHMATDHPEDYAICFAALSLIITSPTLIGHAPKRTTNFELYRRVNHPEGKVVMAAVGLEVDGDGHYRIRTSYLASGEVVNDRRLAGRLKPPPSSR
jgi:hypothetical protein